jgi:DNA-binding CsgD family transcriptional regulator
LRAVGCITDITEFLATGIEPLPWPATPLRAGPTSLADGLPAAGGARATLTARRLLSERERECLAWVSMGKTAWETALILGRSRRTVEFHLKNAIGKLNASNKIHAVTLAIGRGLL